MSDRQVQINLIENQLHNEAVKIRAHHLRNLIHSRDRATLCLQFEDLIVDFTRQPLTRNILQKLMELAEVKSLPNYMEELFSGEVINLTECQPVNHCKQRAPEHQNSMDYKKLVSFADAVRLNKNFKSIVNLGIGGSDLGPSMVTSGLSGFHDGPKVHYVGNADPAALFDVLAQCEPNSTLFIVTSKSFSTFETLANAALAKDWLQKNDVVSEKSMVAVTSHPNQAKILGFKADCIFSFDEGVGGRYSLWSAVGLPAMIAIGSDAFADLLAGAHVMDTHFRGAPLAANIPVIMGLLRVWHRTYMGNMAYGLMPYDHRLSRLPAWAQQLEMESNGKGVDRFGNVLLKPAAPLIWGDSGTNNQHSFFQWLHQGLDTVPIDILVAQKPAIMSEDHDWQTHHKALLINAVAQAEALASGSLNLEEPHRNCPGNRPSVLISWDMTTPYSLGRLLALYEHVTIVSGFIWGVNSFDQWGVELGKKIAVDISKGEILKEFSPAGLAFLERLNE